MWVLPKNYQPSSAFVADTVGSKEDLILLESSIESSLMWRSKPTSLRIWLQKWNRVNWLPHLFGRTLKLSQHTYFEEQLILSLAAIRASRSLQQEEEKESKTLDTYSPISKSILKLSDQIDAFSRMSTDTFRWDSLQSLAIWKNKVTEQNGEYSAREKLVLHTKENESLSWPTPVASDWRNMDTANQMSLSKAVKIWGTPTTHIAKEKAYPAEWERSTMTLTAEVHQAEGLPHSTGYLNPEWVEWLMGVPTGWTGLDSWGTE